MSYNSVHGPQQSKVQVFNGRKGFATVKVTGENGTETLLHSLYDPVREAEGLIPDAVRHETVVFLGAGLGYHIPPTLERYPEIKRVLIIEMYPQLAGLAAALVTDPRVKIDVVTADSLSKGIPSDINCSEIQIISHHPSLHANPAWYSRWHALLATAGSPGNSRNAINKGPLTILVPYGAYYCQAECIRGFEELGHRVLVLDYRQGESDIIDAFRHIMTEDRPDLVFSVNMRGFDRHGVMYEILGKTGIPLVLWFVDSPEFILHGEKLPSPEICRVFVWDKSYLPSVSSLGYGAAHLPLAADPALAVAARHSDRFQADISFVGNSLCSGFLNRLASKFPKTGKTTELAGKAISQLISCRGRQLEKLQEILEGIDERLSGKDEFLFYRAYILHGATTRYRTSLLERLLELPLSFFGDPDGWKRVFGRGINAHPDVDYFTETPSVYASSKLNFNATSFQMPKGVNQRVFDVPMCGGFLLTDRQDELFGLFEDDEVAVYECLDDVAEKARYYLSRPELRSAIAEKARKRVMGEHTYRHRMGKMLDSMFG